LLSVGFVERGGVAVTAVSDFFVYALASLAAGAGLAQVFMPPGWSLSARAAFRMVMIVALFFALGLYWLKTGESPVESLYRYALCPLQPNAPKCVAASEQDIVKPPDKTIAQPPLATSILPVATSVPPPGTVFRDTGCPGDCPEMVVLPRGNFIMGSTDGQDDEKPPHPVSIGYDLAVGKFEVTRAEFAAFVSDTGHKTDGGCFTWDGKDWKQREDKSWRDPGFVQTARDPITCVNWNDALAYVSWLAGKTKQKYRLLSEAEWEYAARAGSTKAYAWGDSIGKNLANCDGCGSAWDNKQTAPAGSFAANAFGLHDMHGNVWEWVQDCYAETYRDAPEDGTSIKDMSADCHRVLRGGSWNLFPRFLRAAFRSRNSTGDRDGDLGFRVGRTLTP
jgi:formylglycine-generating enzyme required for sulfatase activity